MPTSIYPRDDVVDEAAHQSLRELDAAFAEDELFHLVGVDAQNLDLVLDVDRHVRCPSRISGAGIVSWPRFRETRARRGCLAGTGTMCRTMTIRPRRCVPSAEAPAREVGRPVFDQLALPGKSCLPGAGMRN